MEKTRGSRSPNKAKLNVTLASDVQNWNNTVNEQLVIELAKNHRLKVSGFVPQHTVKQRRHASTLNIELVDAEDFCGFPAIELLSHPPDSLDIDILLIHSHGPGLGRQAQAIKKHKKCKWAQVVHMISEEVNKFLKNPNEYDDEHKLQITLCEKADIIVAIGPMVADAYKRALRYSGKNELVFELTPGVFEELIGIRQVCEDNNVDKFDVLISGSSYFFEVKGCDIAAKAIKLLNKPSYHLRVVLRPCETEQNVSEIKQALLREGIDSRQLTVGRVSENHADWHRWLCAVDLVIKPSRTEGFGMSGLLAISAGVPVLVSSYTGLGKVLEKLPSGASHVVESDDPQIWADKIKEVREKGLHTRHLQAEELRNEYVKQFSWKEQCDQLVETFFKMVQHNEDGTENNDQSLDREVDHIKRQVERASLADKDSSSEKRHKSSRDVVDAGVSPVKSRVNTRLSTKVTSIPLQVYSEVCLKLNVKRILRFDDFRMLAEKVGLNRDETEFIEQKFPNHTDEILKTWSKKSEATVGNLIELLKADDFERIDVAEILENWVSES